MTALEWAQTPKANEPSEDVYCPTRDIAQGRAAKLPAILGAQQWTQEQAYLFVSLIGELANNCFDHNLGTWRDISGCWLEVSSDSDGVRGIIADRGQGVFGSLTRVRPDISDDLQAIRLAFRGGTTGRAPERRGNGLRHVWRTLNEDFIGATLRYCSGVAELFVRFPVNDADLDQSVLRAQTPVPGVYAEIFIFRRSV